MHYEIKCQPEDFKVFEKPNYQVKESGKYAIFKLVKKDYTTERAVQAICNGLSISRKDAGYAGTKDSNAITEQFISLRGNLREQAARLNLKDISLALVGFRDAPLSLGDLEGNSFHVIVRGLEPDGRPGKTDRFVNYFGEQRFSTDNVEIGKAILKKDFKNAILKLMEHQGQDAERIRAHLEKNMNDYVGALKTIPWKNLTLYIHAVQSHLWNKAASQISLLSDAPAALPLVGFGTEFDDSEQSRIIKDVLREEGISPSDFIIRAIPDLSSAGLERRLYTEVHDLQIGPTEDDELHPGKSKCSIRFFLGKGSYATEAIKQMFSKAY